MALPNQSDRGKDKISWGGKVVSIQPRIGFTRSFDQRTHSYLGYILTIEGVVGREERTFTVGLGKEAQAKHQIRAGDVASGRSEVVQDSRKEGAEYYKTRELKVVERGPELASLPPPWEGLPPELEIYRHKKRYRVETFCYGPKSCEVYKAGLTRKVPGRKGMIWEEADWVDEDAVSHRGMDE